MYHFSIPAIHNFFPPLNETVSPFSLWQGSGYPTNYPLLHRSRGTLPHTGLIL